MTSTSVRCNSSAEAEFEQKIVSALAQPPAYLAQALRFMNPAEDVPRYVIGRTDETKAIVSQVKVLVSYK